MHPVPSIAEAAADIGSGKLSPVALAEACLARIEASEARINSFIHLDKARALAQAKKAEAEIREGHLKGPLQGIPFAYKDIFETGGLATTAHSRLLKDYVPKQDAYTVAKLAEAGVVSFGKLATHEFAWGGPSFDLPWPPARNPWNTEHFTGGSSSGTGAAVAAGFILGGTGSDTGGSIRTPSSFCGLAGIKPTYGLLSRSGIQPLAFSLDHAGPLAWTAEDCAMLLDAMAGHDPADPASAKIDLPSFRASIGGGIAGLRIGVVRHFFETDTSISDDVGAAFETSMGVLRQAGAIITDVRLPPLDDWFSCGMILMISEAYSVHEPWLKERYNDYGEYFRDRCALGAFITSADYMAAMRLRRELRTALAKVMTSVDVLALPTTATSAPRLSAMTKYGSFEAPTFTMPFNVSGSPALSICNGFDLQGLPLSMQIVGRPFEDAQVLRVGHTYERMTSWRDRRPQL